MADTNISGIAKLALQARTDMKTANPSKKEQEETDFTSSFMDFMSQSSFRSNVNQAGGTSPDNIQMADSDKTQPVYDSYAARKDTLSVKEEVTAEKIQTEGAESLEEFEENVYQVLEEEYGVSEEEIEAALESLGLTVMDLMNPQNLMAFVTELTGEDAGALLLSENFQNVMQSMNLLTEELASELGITKEQMIAIFDELKQNQEVPAGEVLNTEEMGDVIPETGDAANEPVVTAEAAKDVQTSAAAQEEMGNKNVAEVTQTAEDAEGTKEEQPLQVSVTKVQEEDSKETAQDEGNNQFTRHSGEQKAQTDSTNVHGTMVQDSRVEEFTLPNETVLPSYTSQVNVADIIEQIVNHVKINVSAEATSMEMQLNPEHLGKIYLNISERDGVIRAQIAAQNETVKEALETQMVELRQSLNQQGIKVDAIEVTVATHEFEQNLEGQAKQDEQERQQMEENQKKARRSLNLNDLDGLTGLMTEEEELVAKIMRDNGNQVDLTA